MQIIRRHYHKVLPKDTYELVLSSCSRKIRIRIQPLKETDLD